MTAADVSKDEAVAAVTAAAWEAYNGRKIVHTYAGPFGADWNLADAVAEITAADQVAWVDDMLGHNLTTVSPDGRVIRFDVQRPRTG